MPDKTIACLAIRVLARGEGANSEVDIGEASEGLLSETQSGDLILIVSATETSSPLTDY
jgi:hypothetical protein